jgi:hypothetical protein
VEPLIDSKGKRGEGTTMGKDFLKGLQTSIDASMAFAKKASETFTETNFIKGIGTLGVLGDRITESITPIKQMATTLPGILGTGLSNLVNAVDGKVGILPDPYGPGVETDINKQRADTYQDQDLEHQIPYQPDYLTANMLLMHQLPEETNHC